jgi:glycosyltransferase involved in cell wall biosynthesis
MRIKESMTKIKQGNEETTKIRILISGHLPPPIGGMATYYKNLLNSSLSQYVDYCFVQTSSQKREGSSSGLLTIANLISAIRDCARFTGVLIKFHPRIVHIGTAFGLSFLKHSYCVFVARLMGKRILLHPHCSLMVLYNDRSPIWQWFFRKVIQQTSGIIALSQEWMQIKSIIPGCKVFFLPNFVNIDEYEYALEPHQFTVKNEGSLSVLYLGYLGKAKGTFDLIEAASYIRAQGIDMVFELVGSELTPGELDLILEKVKSLDLGDFIRVNKPAFEAEKIIFFRNADIFVYPSHHEGIPMAVLEAMAAGLPVIASRVGGLPDLIHDNGILIDPEQPEQLANALCSLAKNPTLRLSMQKKSYKTVSEKYNINQHIVDLVDIYKSISSTTIAN